MYIKFYSYYVLLLRNKVEKIYRPSAYMSQSIKCFVSPLGLFLGDSVKCRLFLPTVEVLGLRTGIRLDITTSDTDVPSGLRTGPGKDPKRDCSIDTLGLVPQ